MTRQPPPLRFLTGVLGLWVCARALVLAPDWWVERSAAAPAAASPRLAGEAVAPAPISESVEAERPQFVTQVEAAGRTVRAVEARAPRPRLLLTANPGAPSLAAESPLASDSERPSAAPLPFAAQQQRAALRGGAGSRFSGSAWLLLRGERTAALAPGGTLGGSQSGVRLLYRLNRDSQRPIALSARFYSPAASARGAEAALGLDWQPFARVPVHVLAERRQALGADGRSALALALHGGVSERPLALGVRLDAYGQAGLVGARSRDLFADGAARLTLPVGGIRVGAGIWGGAQPGAARLDAGPHISVRLPLAGEHVLFAVEWRVRVAGDAAPGSGPVLTVGSDF